MLGFRSEVALAEGLRQLIQWKQELKGVSGVTMEAR
jgi:hypothetical protein